jgi:hypothetical protein
MLIVFLCTFAPFLCASCFCPDVSATAMFLCKKDALLLYTLPRCTVLMASCVQVFLAERRHDGKYAAKNGQEPLHPEVEVENGARYFIEAPGMLMSFVPHQS